MSPVRDLLVTLYWLLTLAAFAVGVWMVVAYVPTEATMGQAQKIFYLHMPTAILTLGACLVVFVGSIGYLWQRRDWWDSLAVAGARVAVLYCTIALLTGMLWGKISWGAWWTWTPRLTFTLMLWLLYVVYLILRPSLESGQRRALVSAVYGVIAFLDVPLIWLSARLIPDYIHPRSVTLEPAMQQTLAWWFVPVTMMLVGLIVAQYRLERRIAALSEPPEAEDSAPLSPPVNLPDVSAGGAA